jgi:glycine/D-amino acid oxidase-like deaminating enzyme
MPDEEWDTLVIGAGVIGCATAYHIKRTDPDQRVLLLDRADRSALGNTRRSVALFRDLFTSSTNRDLASSTIALYDHVEDEMGHNLGLRRYGYYWLMDGDRLSSLRGKIADLERGGSDLEVHDREDVVARMGEGLVLEPGAPEGRGPMAPVDGALLARNGGTLSPTRLARWFEGEFRSLGGKVRYGFRVDRLVPGSVLGGDVRVWEDGRVAAVEGPQGRVRADKLVMAAGAWTSSLLSPIGVDGHVRVQTRQAFGLVGQGPSALHEGNGFPGSQLPVVVLPSAGVYLKPIRSQGMLLAGCADNFGRPYGLEEDPRPEPEFLDRQIRPVLESYLPNMREAGVRASWAGQYHYNTIDGNPYVFQTANLTVVAGASGSGIMKSDAIGRVAAAVHAGERRAELFDGRGVDVSDLGVTARRVEPERLII